MKKRLIFMLSVLLSALSATWAQTETTYSPVLDVNFRTADGNTAWNSGYPKNAADEGVTDMQLKSNAGQFALQKYTVTDLQYATKLVLTLTVGGWSGVDAVRVWSLPVNDWTASSGIDDIYPKVKEVLGVDMRSTEGTPNSPLVTGVKVANSSPAKATFTITGTALATIKANATSDGTFTLLLTNNDLLSSSNQRSYLSNNSSNDEANRPTLVATTTAPAAKTAKIVGTGIEYETLLEAFNAAVNAGTDAEIEVSGDQVLTDRLTLNKAITITITPTKAITIKGQPGKIWFLANTNNAVLNVGGDYTITLNGENKSYTGGDVAKYESNSTISLKNVVFKDFDLNNAGHLVGSKANEGQMILENVTFNNCVNPASAYINKLRVTNDRLVLKGYLNQTGCTGTTIYAAAETKSSGTTGRIKIDDANFTANETITINFAGATYSEGVVVVIGTSADNATKFALTDEDWTLERKSNGDLIMAKPVTPTAKIGDTNYVDLTAALAAAQDGDNIELLGDQEITSRVNIKNISLAISGNYTISRASSYTNGLLFLTQKADDGYTTALTLDGVTLDGGSTAHALIEASNYAATTLKDVTVQNTTNTANAVIVNKGGGRLVLNGVTFTNCSGAKGIVFDGNSVTLLGENTIPSIYVEKQLVLNAAGATATTPIQLLTDDTRKYGQIVKGDASQFTSSAFRLSQQGNYVYAMMLPVAASYEHPALLHTDADIARVKGMLTEEPFKSAYSALEAASGGVKTGAVEWLKRMDKTNWESTYSDYANFSRLVTDAKLAYYLALRYQLKGLTAAATAAVNILNDWATNCKGFLRLEGYANEIPDPNEYLMLIQAYQMANAAELLTNYNGWAAADQTTFKNWMRQTFADVAYLFLSTREDQHYWLNWDLAALNALVSVGVLCDDKALIDYALDYINNGAGTGNKDNAIVATHNDTDSDETLAQCQESGRDQGHATLDVTLMGVLCQMAENANIGTNLWTEYKALEMAEYIGKYNLKNSTDAFCYDNVPFTEYSNGEVTHTAISSDARGTVRPSWELFYAYAKNNGKAARYSQMWAEQARNNNAGGETTSTQNDELGFGTLMFYDAGDATDYSYTLSVSDAGAATLILPFDATIPVGVEVYTLNYTAGASAAQATEVTTTLPANTPVLVIADEGNYTFTGASIWQQAATMTSDALTGVYQKTVVPSGSYILTKKDDKVGFRKADGSTNTVEANRAYLTATGASAPMLSINFGGGTTGISQIESGELRIENVYNLNGQRVAQPNKGLYIVNGKKVVIK